jgi:hypothetical protein
MRKWFTLIIVLLAVSPVAAQQSAAPVDYPTVTALEQAVIPLADRVSLAQRFNGVGAIPPPPASAPARKVGEQETFWVSNNDRDFQVTATLRVAGEHIYFWVEDGPPVNDADLRALAKAFDQHIYPTVRELWGSEAIPGIDGDPRIYGLFAHDLGAGTSAYFMSRNSYPSQVYPTSNQHEMLLFNLDDTLSYMDSPVLESVVAHEFQHMIRANLQDNDSTWMNEGFSTFTQLLLYNDTYAIPSFLADPQTQLDSWAEATGDRIPHYGAATLWIAYFYERYGEEALRRVSADPGTGLDAFDHVLQQLNQPDVNTLFADWVLANFMLTPELEDGRYGYKLMREGLFNRPPVSAVMTDYPTEQQGHSNQYATSYFVASNLQGKTTLNLSIDSPQDVALVPVQPASGKWMWYSNVGDQSDMTLTHVFDLSDVKNAALEFKVWYDIEDLWDWGYVTVSADDGKTWKALPGTHAQTDNPVNTAYGPGYSGESGGWQDERIALDDYAGQSILLRFEMITDDAVTKPGLAIDDVQIPAIGYRSDFEQDGGGWEAEGWIRTDNRLPQQVWVQALQLTRRGLRQARLLAPTDGSNLSLNLNGRTDEAIIVVSPFAPVTTVPVQYTLHVNASSGPIAALPVVDEQT